MQSIWDKTRKFYKPIRFSPLGVVCLKKIEVRVPFVPNHLNEQRNGIKILESCIDRKTSRTLKSKGIENLNDERDEERTFPQVKQRTGMIIFAPSLSPPLEASEDRSGVDKTLEPGVLGDLSEREGSDPVYVGEETGLNRSDPQMMLKNYTNCLVVVTGRNS